MKSDSLTIDGSEWRVPAEKEMLVVIGVGGGGGIANVHAPREGDEIAALKEKLRIAEDWGSEMAMRARRTESEAHAAWRASLRDNPKYPGVKYGTTQTDDEVVISGKLWRIWHGQSSQRESILADQCGALSQRVKDAERARDASQAEVYRLTMGRKST